MARKLIENIELGMVLGVDIKDSQGRMLMAAGTELAVHHIRILRQWRIQAIHVEGDEDEALGWRSMSLDTLDPARHVRNEKHVDDLFRFCNRSEPIMSQVFYFLVDRLDRISVLENKNQ